MFDDKNVDIYSSRDKIREQLLELTRDYLELENFDFNQSSYLSYIINVLSILTSNMIYYNSTIYREFFLTRAQQKESVLNLASMLGHTPELAQPARAQVLMEIPMTFSGNSPVFIIIRGRENTFGTDEEPFKFYAKDVVYTCLNTIEIRINPLTQAVVVTERLTETQGGGSRTIPTTIRDNKLQFLVNTIQLEDIVEEFTIPNLKPYEFYNEEVRFTKHGYLSEIHFVTEESDTIADQNTRIKYEWENAKLNSLFLIPENRREFVYRQINTNKYNGIKLFFGNGIIGAQPNSGWKGRLYYSLTKGRDGEVIAGSITTADRIWVEETIRKINNNTGEIETKVVSKPLIFKVINTSPSFGGKNAPSINQIREDAIARVQANNRFVSEHDFENLLRINPTLPIRNSIHVLKRSDIKFSEINLFTDLVYKENIIPTINGVLKFDYNPSQEKFKIFIGDHFYTNNGRLTKEFPEDNLDINGVNGRPFVSMFNIEVDPNRKECTYKYIVDNIKSPLSIRSVYSNESEIQPQSLTFKINKSDPEDPHIDFIFEYTPLKNLFNSHIHSENDIDVLNLINLEDLRCEISTGWNNRTYKMGGKYFHGDPEDGLFIPDYEFDFSLPLSEIPENRQLYTMTLYKVVGHRDADNEPIQTAGQRWEFNPDVLKERQWELWEPMNSSQTNFIVHSDMSEFMRSTLEVLLMRIKSWEGEIGKRNRIYLSGKVDEKFPKGTEFNIVNYYTPGGSSGTLNFISEGATYDNALNETTVFLNTNYSGIPTGGTIIGKELLIYNVPLIEKNFFDKLSRDENKTEFHLEVYQNLLAFDVTENKMLTDFVNLKFSNTTGKLLNMYKNKLTKRPVIEINPKTLPGSSEYKVLYRNTQGSNFFVINANLEEVKGWVGGKVIVTLDGISSTYTILSPTTTTQSPVSGVRIPIVESLSGGNLIYPQNDQPSMKILPRHKDRYAVSHDFKENPWISEPGGFIAEWNGEINQGNGGWIFEGLIVNDMFKQIDPNNEDEINRFIYNGEKILNPIKDIPLKIHVVVWSDRTISETNEAIAERVKNELVDKMYTSFGYDKNIYIAELTRIVKNIKGIENCKIINPEHDIFFNYDIRKDFSQLDLLQYTPELVYFDTKSISVEVR